MIRLLAVEARRDLTRRLTRLLIVAFVLATLAGLAVAWFRIDTYSDADLAARQERAVDLCVGNAVTFGVPAGVPATIEVSPGDFVEVPSGTEIEQLSAEDAEQRCRDQLAAYEAGEPEGELFYWFDDPRPNVLDFWDPDANGSSFFGAIQSLLMLGALGAAASMVGAEWKAGTITTQLTWSPRRVRLLVAKIAVATVLAVVIAFVLQMVFAGLVVALITAKGGVTAALDGAWWRNLLQGIGRGSFLVGVSAVLGASLASLFRNTAGAVIVVFAYVAVAERLLAVWQPERARWFVGENVGIVLSGQALESVEWHREPLVAAATLTAYALALAVAAAVAFQRRDIASAS